MTEDTEVDIDMPERFSLEPEYIIVVKKGKSNDKDRLK
jgi:hypothetical protein